MGLFPSLSRPFAFHWCVFTYRFVLTEQQSFIFSVPVSRAHASAVGRQIVIKSSLWLWCCSNLSALPRCFVVRLRCNTLACSRYLSMNPFFVYWSELSSSDYWIANGRILGWARVLFCVSTFSVSCLILCACQSLLVEMCYQEAARNRTQRKQIPESQGRIET